MEEGTNDVRVAAQPADGCADTFLQHAQVGQAQAAQDVLFQPGPEPFVGGSAPGRRRGGETHKGGSGNVKLFTQRSLALGFLDERLGNGLPLPQHSQDPESRGASG